MRPCLYLSCLLPLLYPAPVRAEVRADAAAADAAVANAAVANAAVANAAVADAVPANAAPVETAIPAAAASDTAPDEAGARLTLTLDDAPLLQVLHLLGATGPARFRLGALPDSVVSVRWHDEDPFASLDELARRAGWRFQRDQSDYFLLPLSAASPSGGWAQWTPATTPPRSALTGPDDSMRVKLTGKLAEPPANATGKPASPKTVDRDALKWRALVPAVDSSRAPGLLVQAAQPQGSGAVWLRSVVPLATVPHGARLFLESANPCDVMVNGAPLARNWSGLRAFDMDPLLKRGTNIVAVRWKAPPAPAASASPAAPPALRYEWIFEGGKTGAGLPGENRRERG